MGPGGGGPSWPHVTREMGPGGGGGGGHFTTRVSYRLSAARYSRTRYLSGGTTYHAPSCVATGPAPVITGAATFSP